jgi:hypothetical protein
MPKKSLGGPRADILSVRVPARVKYGLELTARLYHESIPDVVVRALTDVFTSEHGGLFVDVAGEDEPVALLGRVWDERESVRLVKLGLTYPALLKPVEKRLWAHVQADAKYWAPVKGKSAQKTTPPHRQVGQLDAAALEADWADLQAKAELGEV